MQGTDPHSIIGSSAVLPYGHNKGWSFSLSFNDTNDITTLSFSQTPQVTQVNNGFPIVTSSILSFFGFNQRVNLNQNKEAVEFLREQQLNVVRTSQYSLQQVSNQPINKNTNSGGRLPIGNPPSGTISSPFQSSQYIVSSIEGTMNGSWFGAIGETVDQVPASNFTLTFINTLTNLTEVASIRPGRYTPAELAQQFTNALTFVTATAVYAQDFVY